MYITDYQRLRVRVIIKRRHEKAIAKMFPSVDAKKYAKIRANAVMPELMTMKELQSALAEAKEPSIYANKMEKACHNAYIRCVREEIESRLTTC